MSSNISSQNRESGIPKTQNVVSILWPSFLVASLSTILCFTFFDPSELGMISGFPDISRLAGYSIGFFMFWFICGVSSALTSYFRLPCHKVKSESE